MTEAAPIEHPSRLTVGDFAAADEPLRLFGQWLEDEGRADEAGPVLGEARSIFEDLKAKWWLDRLDRPAVARSAVGSERG